MHIVDYMWQECGIVLSELWARQTNIHLYVDGELVYMMPDPLQIQWHLAYAYHAPFAYLIKGTSDTWFFTRLLYPASLAIDKPDIKSAIICYIMNLE